MEFFRSADNGDHRSALPADKPLFFVTRIGVLRDLIKTAKKYRLYHYLFVHSVDHIMSVRRNYATI